MVPIWAEQVRGTFRLFLTRRFHGFQSRDRRAGFCGYQTLGLRQRDTQIPSPNSLTYVYTKTAHNSQPYSPARPGSYGHPTTHTQNPAPLQHTDPQPTTLLAELPRPRVFLTVDMSHWSPNTDLGVSLQRAIYISLSICQPV